jgi:hypothetical protein
VHIHEIEGIKAPKFISLIKYDNDILVISATDPKNRSKKGYRIEGYYRRELRDNWGNIHLRYTRSIPRQNNRQLPHSRHIFFTLFK